MADELTPMQRQYLALKREVPPGAILMFRLGDFYEMFGEDAVERFGYPISGRAKELVKFWPGALTLVIGAEGFRVPDHDWTRRLLAKCGGLLRVTSANLSGQRPATDAPAALADVGLSADIVVDDGVSPGGVPSTVVRVSPDGATEVLRAGAVAV